MVSAPYLLGLYRLLLVGSLIAAYSSERPPGDSDGDHKRPGKKAADQGEGHLRQCEHDSGERECGRQVRTATFTGKFS